MKGGGCGKVSRSDSSSLYLHHLLVKDHHLYQIFPHMMTISSHAFPTDKKAMRTILSTAGSMDLEADRCLAPQGSEAGKHASLEDKDRVDIEAGRCLPS